jgi:hypothetical protein
MLYLCRREGYFRLVPGKLIFRFLPTVPQQVLVDGSLRDADWYMEYFQQLRNDFPFLRIAILHITAPKEIVLERAAVSTKLFQPDIISSSLPIFR